MIVNYKSKALEFIDLLEATARSMRSSIRADAASHQRLIRQLRKWQHQIEILPTPRARRSTSEILADIRDYDAEET